ncbi:MAG: DUF368 domain-containing protein [Spirochaetaceae bacterium]|jgi:putative membrane protein|nr:DUF368 domain-containing protein [Spirochaetaceae bacterium]
METIKLVGIGLILGIANVIPGVSGGTVAVVFQIYDRLIAVITPDMKKIAGAWKFWLPLGAGAAGGVVFLSAVMTALFARHPIPTNWFFIGVVLGSVPMLYPKIHAPAAALPDLPGALWCFAGLGVMVLMKVLRVSDESAVYTSLTPARSVHLFSGGLAAAGAMLIPGISGSFLLLAMGLYPTVIRGIADFNIPLLIPAALGVGAGLFSGAALVRLLLRRAPRQTYAAALGLVAGSALALLPREGLGSGVTALVSLASLLAGSVASARLRRFHKLPDTRP